ncbi:MAG: thioesterase family protein [Myxococcales bacterium]|nr:thioesterase family protein [Myxococcales bacterium]
MSEVLPPVFRRDGEFFVPTDAAPGPWSPKALHGGPVCGLLCRCLEQAVDDSALLPARLTIDLFRAVPKAPLSVKTRVVRDGRRIKAVDASILHEDTEVARASGLFLLRTEHELNDPFALEPMPGPDGLETGSLMGGRRPPGAPRGFHTVIQARWATKGLGPQAAWFRLPTELVEGEATSPFARAAAVGDFANAVASRSMRREPGVRGPSFINTDTTLYFSRAPVGEWLGMAADYGVERDGIGLIEVALFDTEGRCGRSVQARLANRRNPGPAKS